MAGVTGDGLKERLQELHDSFADFERGARATLAEAVDTIERLEARAAECERHLHAVKDEKVRLVGELNLANDRISSQSAKIADLEAERERDAAVLEADGHSFKLAEKCPMCGRHVDDARIDERIVNVRFNHPGGHSATEGITLPLALKMAEESGGSVDVYLSDHRCWFRLVEGSAWRIETLRAALQHAQEQVGEPDAPR